MRHFAEFMPGPTKELVPLPKVPYMKPVRQAARGRKGTEFRQCPSVE
jgi:hypothetical protein